MSATTFTDADRERLWRACGESAKEEAASTPREVLYDYVAGLARTVCGEFCGGCTCATDDPQEINQLIDAFAAEVRAESAERIEVS